MPHSTPMFRRLLAKLVFEILPAALASVIGGFLLTHYQLGRTAALAPAAEQHTTASAEMMKLVRDEHALIVDFLNAEMAAEKERLAAEERARVRAAADARPATPAVAPRRSAAAMVAAKALAPREPTVAAAPAPLAPAALAPIEQNSSTEPARDSNSLLARTIRIKDSVVTATQRAAFAIGGIPSWIAGVGDRIGGQQGANATTNARVVSASW